MNIDTPDAELLEQIETLPVGLIADDIEQIRSAAKLSVYAETLDSQKAGDERVLAVSEIREERTFSKKDILKLMVLFAMANKLELDKLSVTKIINNKDGALVVLEVKSPNSDGSYRLFEYTIKGRHEGSEARITCIVQTRWDSDDMPEGGENIADFAEGKWRYEQL